jgi:capsid protein
MYGEVGEDVKLIEPNLNAQDFSQFALMLLDQICAPIGLFPEEVLIGYRNSNYSSARADRIRLTDVLKDIRKEREAFCDRVIERQTGIAVDSGEIQDAGDGTADITYGWPVVREIDETKHVQAQAVALANGSKSLDQICAENGTFADQVQAQIVRGAVRMAKTVKAYAQFNAPTKAQIEAQTVTQKEILAHMPNATAASEALNALANADAAGVNAQANADRAIIPTV